MMTPKHVIKQYNAYTDRQIRMAGACIDARTFSNMPTRIATVWSNQNANFLPRVQAFSRKNEQKYHLQICSVS